MKRKLQIMVLMLLGIVLSINQVWGAEGDAHDFAQSISQGLNNSASISIINIAEQSYPVKGIKITCRYNKTIDPAVTINVSIGGNSWATSQTVGNNFNGTKTFEGTTSSGAIQISFTNHCGSGTGKGTFYVTNVQLIEGGPEKTCV